MTSDTDDISGLLDAAARGSEEARDQLLARIYDELHALAQRRLAAAPWEVSIQWRSLVHEVYLKRFDRTKVRWENRAHVFGAAARAMRELIVDHARHHSALKRGGDRTRVDLDEGTTMLSTQTSPEVQLAVSRGIDRLSKISALSAEVVLLRFYAGLTHEEAASELDISVAQARREWAYAKAFLRKELRRH